MKAINLEVGEYTPESGLFTHIRTIITEIVSTQDQAAIKAIEEYCEENGYITNIIEKEKLEEILFLGFTEYERRKLEEGNNNEDR